MGIPKSLDSGCSKQAANTGSSKESNQTGINNTESKDTGSHVESVVEASIEKSSSGPNRDRGFEGKNVVDLVDTVDEEMQQVVDIDDLLDGESDCSFDDRSEQSILPHNMEPSTETGCDTDSETRIVVVNNGANVKVASSHDRNGCEKIDARQTNSRTPIMHGSNNLKM